MRLTTPKLAMPQKPLSAAQLKMLERLRVACRAGKARARYDALLDELAFSARDHLRFHPRARHVPFEGVKFPVGTGAMIVSVLDPATFEPLVSAIRTSPTGEQR